MSKEIKRPTFNIELRKVFGDSRHAERCDIYFARKPPKGQESNWLQTVPGKSWFIALRMYGPLQPWIDQTWRPGEIELVK